MKNSRNKVIVAAMCGLITGSVGTSLIGNFQTVNNESSVTASKNDRYNSLERDEAVPDDGTLGGGNSESHSENGYEYKKGNSSGKGGKGGHHKGQASLDSTESVDVASGSYNDGTYEGTADGFSNNLNVKVVISSGKIADVRVVSHNETPGFYERAFEEVTKEIVENQSTDVDTTSGATYSSVGIINAVNDALSSAKA